MKGSYRMDLNGYVTNQLLTHLLIMFPLTSETDHSHPFLFFVFALDHLRLSSLSDSTDPTRELLSPLWSQCRLHRRPTSGPSSGGTRLSPESSLRYSRFGWHTSKRQSIAGEPIKYVFDVTLLTGLSAYAVSCNLSIFLVQTWALWSGECFLHRKTGSWRYLGNEW